MRLDTNPAMQSLEETIVRFDIHPEHSLKQQNREQHEKNQTIYDVCWFVEKDGDERIVARYRSWCNQAQTAPFRLQVGWERYSPGGTLLEREVSYAKLDNKTTLH